MANDEQCEKAKGMTLSHYYSLIDTLKIRFFHIQSIVIETNTYEVTSCSRETPWFRVCLLPRQALVITQE